MAAKPSKEFRSPLHWTIQQRLDHYTDKSGGADACWTWKGAITGRGYGHMKSKQRHRSAHRTAWICANGPVPDGLFVCHHCDNPRCVNPGHLFVDTPAGNMTDKVKKGRARGLSRPGMASPAAKLTDDQVITIRGLRGTMKNREIAKRFGVHESTVERILYGKSWRHI